jgi:hypothetical protein
MRVEHPIPVDQESEPPEVPSRIGKAETQRIHLEPDLKANSRPMLEDPQPLEDASTRGPERLDADLAFEYDELLKPDSRITSHGPKVWKAKGLNLKLSALEATVAVKRGVFTYDDFEV